MDSLSVDGFRNDQSAGSRVDLEIVRRVDIHGGVNRIEESPVLVGVRRGQSQHFRVRGNRFWRQGGRTGREKARPDSRPRVKTGERDVKK